MPYYPWPNQTITIVEVMQYNNLITGDMFGVALIIIIFMILFVAQKAQPTEKAFASSMLITTLLTYMMAIIGLVSSYITLIPTLMTVVSLFLLMRTAN